MNVATRRRSVACSGLLPGTLAQYIPLRAATAIQPMRINLAFMNDLDIVAVRIEQPCRIIARVVFGPSLRCFLALASSADSRSVEAILLSMVLRHKSNMPRLGIGLSFFEPEKN